MEGGREHNKLYTGNVIALSYVELFTATQKYAPTDRGARDLLIAHSKRG